MTLRDERSKANLCRLAGVTEMPLCVCVWPFQHEFLVGAGSPHTASAAFVLAYETNLTVTSQSSEFHYYYEILSNGGGHR